MYGTPMIHTFPGRDMSGPQPQPRDPRKLTIRLAYPNFAKKVTEAMKDPL